VSRGISPKPFLSWVPHWCVLVFIVDLLPAQGKKKSYINQEIKGEKYLYFSSVDVYINIPVVILYCVYSPTKVCI